ncbi:MAG: pyruvate formate lyase family protein [Acidobacteriota bacterium]|jgi:formate C-acetyltransferase|nr:pyruvate formate lyase family protein [Acidobacteriota bacterium]
MFVLSPVTDRVARIREKYRTTRPRICIARYKIVTEFYQENPQLQGILKRARNFKNICEKLPVLINKEEIIVGWQATQYRACALYPEISFGWFLDELKAGTIPLRDVDPYDIDPDDADYVLKTGDFWRKESLSAKVDEHIPLGYLDAAGSGVTYFSTKNTCTSPVGHFVANFEKAMHKGFGAIRAEAQAKMDAMEGVLFGDSAAKYTFYRAITLVCDGMITLSKRYGQECEKLAAAETDPARKKELLEMADCLNWIMEHPCRTFHDALQCMFLYQIGLCLDAQQHGISFGRVDQYLGSYYEADIAAGRITHEKAQELLDLFYLKVAEMNKIWPYFATLSGPGYTSGQLMTIGGVTRDGKDATNPVSFMMLQSAGRLVLHDPPQSLRIHKGTPQELWDAAIETTQIAGGVPTFENDDVIIPALMARGLPLESARNYCLIGCVEPQGCGDEWACPGGNGTESFFNLLNAFLLGINNGYNPFPTPDGKPARQTGLPTGYLYEMETFDEVLNAVQKQIEYFVNWHISLVNTWEFVASEHMQLPLLSATIDGCMESGRDVMKGGAKYNSTGNAGIAIGNIADSLAVVKYMVYDKKRITARELYDAIMSNWEGKEDLRQQILNEAPRYGNDNEYADQFARWASDIYGNAVNAATGPRGRYAAGLYPVTAHVLFGMSTAASPDGRKAGEPLADGISPVQQMDKCGPTATLKSVSAIDQKKFSNGTLLNMRFHPTALRNETGKAKLIALIRTYFALGGMETQFNIVSGETLRKAQEKPEDYRDLVVRIAGFSAYFVELYKASQDDIIKRTELTL